MRMTSTKAALNGFKSCCGVDLQSTPPVFVKAERSRGGVTCTPVPSAGDLPAVGALSPAESLTCLLDAPFASFRKAEKVFPTLLDVQIPFPLEECVYAFLDPGSAAPTLEPRARALAVAARLADVEKKVESFKTVNLDPLALDHEGLALWTQSLREKPPVTAPVSRPRIVVCLREDRWILALGLGDRYISSHVLRAGDTAQVSRILKARLQAEPTPGEPPPKPSAIQWAWTGPGASNPALVRSLEEALLKDWPGSSWVHEKPETFLARALATRALLSGPLRCNLRAGPWTHPEMLRLSRRSARWILAAYLAAGLILCTANLYWSFAASRKESDLDREFKSLASRLAGYPMDIKGEQALKKVSDALTPQKEKLRPFMGPFEPSLVAVVGSLADIARQNDLRFETLTLARDKVSVSGTAGGWNRCEKLAESLRKAGYAVKLERKDALIDDRIPFTVGTGGSHD